MVKFASKVTLIFPISILGTFLVKVVFDRYKNAIRKSWDLAKKMSEKLNRKFGIVLHNCK
jgi:hypothetical protein